MRSAAFFDIDGTLLRGESQFSFMLWCLRRGVAPRLSALPVLAQYVSYLVGLSSDAVGLRQSGFRLLRGIPVQCIDDAVTEFFHADLAGRFRLNAASLVNAHRLKGNLIVVITSACEQLANLVAARVKADAVLSTHLIITDEIFTGERELPEPYGDGKRILVERFCIERGLSPADCFAYTDHHTDAALLKFIGHPVVVNPTRQLRAIALKHGWPQVDLDAKELPAQFIQENN